MLEKLGFKKKTHVGIALSANNFLELVCIDNASKSVIRYASGNVKYNNAIKEIIDLEEFKEVLVSLFDSVGLEPASCAVTLSVPSVHFDIKTMDSGGEGEPFLIEDIQADIEDLYIFKRNEPVISHITLPGEGGIPNIVYGAIQQKMVATLIEVFDALGTELVCIQPSYCSILNALQYNEKYKDLFDKEEKTLILLVTQSNCATFSMKENIIVDYKEEPLAVKSFSPEEVYAAVSRIAESAISKNAPSNVLIISETSDINAELLSQKTSFSGQIVYINKSIDLNDSFIDMYVDEDSDNGSTSFVSIESVGAAVNDYDSFPLEINFLPSERKRANIVNVGGYEVEFTRFLVVILLTAVILAFLIALLFGFIISNQTESLQQKSTLNQTQIDNLKREIDKNSSSSQQDVLKQLTEVLDNNKKLTEVYVSLSTDIPDGVYIKKFVTNETGAVGITGEAKSSESVEKFVRELREKNSLLMLSKLSVNSQYDAVPGKIPNGFTFEIKTQGKDIFIPDDATILQKFSQTTNGQTSGNPYPSNSGGMMLPPPSPII